jgi:large subunit ribosomal protein L17
MRHRHKGKTLDRARQPRRLMLRNLAASVILYEKVTTTPARAKAVQPIVERAVTLGRRGGLVARRRLQQVLPVRSAVAKTVEVLGARYQGRSGGYTRVVRLGRRRGDGAEVVRLELV